MDEYIEKLNDYCKEHNIEPDQYVAKVKNYFELGKQIDLTDQQIIQRLGTVEELVNTEQKDYVITVKDDDQMNFDKPELSIEMPFDVDVIIESNNNNEVSIDYDDDKLSNYIQLSVSKKAIDLSAKGAHLKNIDGEITLSLPDNLSYKSVRISTVSGDIDCDDYGFICDKFKLESVSGDCNFKFIKAEDVSFDIVSSDTTVENLDCQYCKLNSVNGDITIEKSIIDHLKVNTVSGDVNVDGQIANSSSDTISGDIYINGEKKKISFPFR